MAVTRTDAAPSDAAPSLPTRSIPTRRPRRWIVLVAMVVAGFVFWDGARRTPTPPATGTGLRGDLASPGATGPRLRVGTFNICSGKGLDGKTDLRRATRVVKGCDLVGLNEVRGPSMLGGPDQAEVLGRSLGMQWLFAPSERQRWHDSFGNAVLSDLPVAHWQRFPVSAPWANGNRSVLMLKVPWNGTTVHVLITHLDKGADRGPELMMVSELFRALTPPAILMADLNTFPDDPRMDLLRKTPGVTDVLDRPAIESGKRVDWIIVKGLRCTDAGRTDDGTSDHPFYWADLTIADPG